MCGSAPAPKRFSNFQKSLGTYFILPSVKLFLKRLFSLEIIVLSITAGIFDSKVSKPPYIQILLCSGYSG
jgi:hypothetical protein